MRKDDVPMRSYMLDAIQKVAKSTPSFTLDDVKKEVMGQVGTTADSVSYYFYNEIKKRGLVRLKQRKGNLRLYELTEAGASTDPLNITAAKQTTTPAKASSVVVDRTLRTPRKVAKEPVPLSGEVSSLLGESVIRYIEQLKEKIQKISTHVSDGQRLNSKEVEKLRLDLKDARAQVEELKKENEKLRGTIRGFKENKSSSFNLEELATFR